MRYNPTRICLFAVILGAATLFGCASQQTSSSTTPAPAAAVSPKNNVQIFEGVPNKKYKEIGPIEVSVKKLTIFHQDPTKEQANEALGEKARAIGADAVIKVTYESGIGLTSWGYIDATGTAVKLNE
jgi:hypothetical protein